MSLILIIILLVLLFGGGWGWQAGYYGPGVFGGIGGLLVLILILWLVMGRI